MMPWKQGKPLVWDATCPDTLAPSYRDMASIRTGAVAATAEERKVAKYIALGAIGPKSLAFIRDLGYRMQQRTGEERALTYLLQRLSVAIQRGNLASAMGSIGN